MYVIWYCIFKFCLFAWWDKKRDRETKTWADWKDA